MNRDLVKATLLGVVCVIALGESLLLGRWTPARKRLTGLLVS